MDIISIIKSQTVPGDAQTSNPMKKIGLLAFALPVLPVYLVYGSITVMQGIYVKYFGMNLSDVAKMLLIARLFDAFSDPLIGYMSDRCYAKTGSRKLFVIIGAVAFIISSYFLYVPVPNFSPLYFLGWLVAFYLTWTIFEIPHMSWGSDISSNYHEKNNVYSLRILGVFSGYLLFFCVPLIPTFEAKGFTPSTLKWAVTFAGILLIPSLIFCYRSAPSNISREYIEGYVSSKKSPIKYSISFGITARIEEIYLIFYKNKPFLIFLISFIFTGVGTGMWFSLLFIYVDSYLSIGDKLPLIYLIGFSASIVFLFIAKKTIEKHDKRITWILGMMLVIIGLLGTAWLRPGYTSLFPLIVLTCLIYIGFILLNVMAPSLLSDISEYGRLKTGKDHTGLYFSIYTLTNKTAAAIGGSAGLAITSAYDYDPTIDSNSDSAIFGIHLAISWIPAPLIVASIMFIWLIPINARRHSVIRRRLDK